jgi:hypothetical protein
VRLIFRKLNPTSSERLYAPGGFTGHPHFLNASSNGPVWLPGGGFGAEASWPNLALLTIWAIGFSLWLRGLKYPNPAAVRFLPCLGTMKGE